MNQSLVIVRPIKARTPIALVAVCLPLIKQGQRLKFGYTPLSLIFQKMNTGQTESGSVEYFSHPQGDKIVIAPRISVAIRWLKNLESIAKIPQPLIQLRKAFTHLTASIPHFINRNFSLRMSANPVKHMSNMSLRPEPQRYQATKHFSANYALDDWEWNWINKQVALPKLISKSDVGRFIVNKSHYKSVMISLNKYKDLSLNSENEFNNSTSVDFQNHLMNTKSHTRTNLSSRTFNTEVDIQDKQTKFQDDHHYKAEQVQNNIPFNSFMQTSVQETQGYRERGSWGSGLDLKFPGKHANRFLNQSARQIVTNLSALSNQIGLSTNCGDIYRAVDKQGQDGTVFRHDFKTKRNFGAEPEHLVTLNSKPQRSMFAYSEDKTTDSNRLNSPADVVYKTQKSQRTVQSIKDRPESSKVSQQSAQIDIDRLSRDVWNQIEKRIRIERERHGRL